ncbi:MAG: bifunctional 4-hydroxy-2-oxoglutarate aldolase/2-dehydro-3-deoxy-phosphogluconate aldolase [Geminicoccaceae bacterium]
MSVPKIEPLLSDVRVIPVLVLEDRETALPLAEALLAGGLRVLEVTLRSPAALACTELLATRLPEALIGVGTLTRPEQFGQARDAGARFLVSPGLTPRLAEAASACALPYLPGVATVSEALAARELGFFEQKFFPAALSGGAKALKGMAPLLPDIRFCPTGGLSAADIREMLSLPNVFALGGGWLAPVALVRERRWRDIEQLAREAAQACPAQRV